MTENVEILPEIVPVDFNGTPIEKGSRILYPTDQGNSLVEADVVDVEKITKTNHWRSTSQVLPRLVVLRRRESSTLGQPAKTVTNARPVRVTCLERVYVIARPEQNTDFLS